MGINLEWAQKSGGHEKLQTLSIDNSPRSFVVKGRRNKMVAGDGNKDIKYNYKNDYK